MSELWGLLRARDGKTRLRTEDPLTSQREMRLHLPPPFSVPLCENLFVHLSPPSPNLVTQDWCNRMQSGSLLRLAVSPTPSPARSIPSASLFFPDLQLPLSTLPSRLSLLLSQTISPALVFSLYLSICFIVRSSPPLSRFLVRSRTMSTHGWRCRVQVDLCNWTR